MFIKKIIKDRSKLNRSLGNGGMKKNTYLLSKVQCWFLYQRNMKENGFVFAEKGKSNEYWIT